MAINALTALSLIAYGLYYYWCQRQTAGARVHGLDWRLLALLLCHLLLLGASFVGESGGWRLQLWPGLSALLWLLVLALGLSRARIGKLLQGVLIAAVVSVVLPYLLPPVWQVSGQRATLMIHIGCSLLSLGVAVLALALNLVNSYQSSQVKKSAISLVPAWLPPVFVFERLIFICIWQGFFLLVVAMFSGYFIAQQQPSTDLLDYKILLSLVAWSTLSALLFQHYRSGWRGYKVSWAMSVAVLLMFVLLIATNLK